MFKTGKLYFDKKKNFINTDETDPGLFRQLAIPKAARLTIELIEITAVDNPSDIKIEIIFQQLQKKRIIHLYKYRAAFLHQNGVFLLDTKGLSEFDLDITDLIFLIRIISEKDFKITMYYATDQKENLLGYEAL